MADDGYTTIFHTTDAAQGGLVAEMLRDEGIDARFHGVSSTLIGLHAGLVEMAVTVPVAAEARARELLADLEYVGAAEAVEHGHEAASDDGPEAPEPPSRWRALSRAAFTLFLPGTVHLYAGRPWTALVLALSAACCVAGAVAAPSRIVGSHAFVATIFMIVLWDMVHGVRVAAAELRGERLPGARQVLEGIGLTIVAWAMGLGVSLAIAAPSLWRAHVLERFSVTCTQSGVTFESRDSTDRDLVFNRLGVAAPVAIGTEGIYDVGLPAGSAVRLNAGASARTPFVLDEKRAKICVYGRGCRMVFDVTLAATERGPLPLQARGECTPDWGETSAPIFGRLWLVDLASAGE